MYAVYQAGYSICGIGETASCAVTAALEWVERDTPPDAITAAPHVSQERCGALYMRECSNALATAVQQNGGNVLYVVDNNGILCLAEEQEQARAYLVAFTYEDTTYYIRQEALDAIADYGADVAAGLCTAEDVILPILAVEGYDL